MSDQRRRRDMPKNPEGPMPPAQKIYNPDSVLKFLEDWYPTRNCYSLETGVSSSYPLSDLQTLEYDFGRMGVSDSSARQQQSLDNRRSNQQFPLESRRQGMNGGRYWLPLNSQQEFEREQFNQMQRLWFPMDNCVNGYDSHNTDFRGRSSNGVMGSSYNTLFNRDLGDVPCSTSNNPFLNQNPLGFSYDHVSRNRNGGGSVYDHDPYTMNNGRATILSRAIHHVESRRLQDEIVEGSRETIDEIFDNLISHVCELMVDNFGHHVFHKLLEKCTDEQINCVLDMVIQKPQQLVSVCSDPHGTRAIQDLMRCLRFEEQKFSFMGAICRVGLLLTKNTNANNVIVFCFKHFSHSHIRSLLEVILQNCYEIAIDQHGCCMLQQCIGKSSGEVRDSLIMGIITNALKLCVNCYGNYVVQYVLELEDREVAEALSSFLKGHYVHLSYDKYGSHAVQKCLKSKVFNSRRIIIELLSDIESLLVNPFGNYVIQTAWIESQNDVRYQLYYRIKDNYSFMKYNRYGRKVLEKLNL